MRDKDSELMQNLHARLRAIPDGLVAGIARKAKMNPDRLRKMRAGLSLDIRLVTLGRISAALGEPISYMLGEEAKIGDRPTLLPGQVPISEVQLRRMIVLLRKMARVLARTAENLPQDQPQPGSKRGKAPATRP